MPSTDDDALRQEEERAALRLALAPGIGPRLRKALLAHFASATKVLAASQSALRKIAGIGSRIAETVHAARGAVDVDRLLDECHEHDIRIVWESDAAYPTLLREISDPPPLLFVRGTLTDADCGCVAVVGSRQATLYGQRQAERLARQLVDAGLTVVSGLARGIDGAAHRGALDAGGRTLAVLGSGLLKIYPAEHTRLAERILANGALLSESPPHQPPRSTAFPRRNRIITGISAGVVVVEATARSGALVSARHAGEQGREVFAVPGRVDNPAARGCHRLLRDGAKLVESVEDILEELAPLLEVAASRLVTEAEDEARATPERSPGRKTTHAAARPAPPRDGTPQRRVYDAVGEEPTAIDAVAAGAELPIGDVLAEISALELKRLVQRISGYYVARR